MEEFDPLLLVRRVSRAIADGLSPSEAHSGVLWEHPMHGLVAPAFHTRDEQTMLLSSGVALMSRHHNALGGWASLCAQGNHWFSGEAADGSHRAVMIHCLPGSQLRRRPGIDPHRGLVHPDEMIDLGGYQVSTLARAAFDEMCRAKGLREAVVALDMATSSTSQVPHASIDAVRHVIDTHHKVRGIVQARRALEHGSTRSASPQETRTRLLATLDADLVGLSVNCPVFSLTGELIGIPDLLDEETGLVVESDGDDAHAGRRTRDNHRQERFERQGGMVVCRVTADDHADRWGTAARLRAARRDAAHRSEQRWTTEKPAWWPTWRHARRWE